MSDSGGEPREPVSVPASVDDVVRLLAAERYVCDRSLATALYLALTLRRPLFLEGEAGVGKTEVARVLAEGLGRELIRLQCYEGLDLASAVYEWNYAAQMMEIRLAEAAGEADRDALGRDVYAERFLVERPILRALRAHDGGPPVLLIDEIDRTDEPFEAFLLEVLSEFQVSVPELGTVRAAEPPIVLLTSNRTREVHDALKRRCLYHWIDYPDAARERAILAARIPDADEHLRAHVVAFVQALRERELYKLPGVAESIDWTHALLALDKAVLTPEVVDDTLGVILKYQDDVERVRGAEAASILDEIAGAVAGE